MEGSVITLARCMACVRLPALISSRNLVPLLILGLRESLSNITVV